VRFLAGVAVGAVTLAIALTAADTGEVVARANSIAPWALAAVVAFVVAEALADGIGVWASVRPLDGGLSPARSVQFALAGDCFDTLSPAGPVSSEPIMARFISVATDTGYSDALGVRSLAKYAKAGSQLAASTVAAGVVLLTGPAPEYVLVTLGASVLVVAVAGGVLLYSRASVSRVAVAALTPIVRRISGVYRDDPVDRAAVTAAVERFWERALAFRDTPGLVALVAAGGLLEQAFVAAALWAALAGTGTAVSAIALFAVVPLPQATSVVPIPGSVGAYDVLLAGGIVATTAAALGAATAAVLVVRAIAITFAAVAGGVCVAFLRGWTPGASRSE
jgi:uncharacterized membrane protein YbhN (UPF0104 family)